MAAAQPLAPARPVVALRGISKRFSASLLANDAIDFDLEAGEIHALLGENGAGKSTLMQILYGLYGRDAGDILIDGAPVEMNGPESAIACGIGMIHQEFMLVESFTVTENLIMGATALPGDGRFRPAAARARIRALSDAYGLDVDPDAVVEHLPVGVRQRVEILKLLFRDARVLILDEPTAVLTPQEVQGLFAVLRSLRDAGRSIVIVTHKMHEVLAISDRVTVLRDGRRVDTVETAATTRDALVRMMVGRSVSLSVDRPPQRPGRTVLSVRRLVVGAAAGAARVAGVDLDLRAGEIVGVAGVDGNGQAELVEALFGLRPVASGGVSFGDQDITDWTPARRRSAGIGYIPADRRRVGSLVELPVLENTMLGDLGRYVRHGFLDRRRGLEDARALIQRFGVRVPGPAFPAGKLSGGNLQKVVLGREVMREPELLLVEQPSRGLDIGATRAVWGELMDQRAAGKAILLVSAELEEILNLSDRIAVMFGGRIAGLLEAAEADLAIIGGLMAGGAAGGHA
ncbi:ABC transporter ATP-binding protein [Labrys wisconsinensis]|uniref:Simple sugar transport system ATP-binding protein n=1 Tax=Labrys wisconsinensis TaxID=425677 RepID=A0ABU0J4R8_9HYPH|nr:ABC transporter ATP-binding protein [Labrys wisconsinensis]MDQ0468182.1 simple sugar transport system ATP-binding protein [Labrys wisconsinensis]